MNKKLRKFAALILGSAMMFSMMGVGTSLAGKEEFYSLRMQRKGNFTNGPTYAIQRFYYFHQPVYRPLIGNPDGIFGDKSYNTTIKFQQNRYIKPVDGIVGSTTYSVMNQALFYTGTHTGGYKRWYFYDYASGGEVGVVQRGTSTNMWGTWNKNGTYFTWA